MRKLVPLAVLAIALTGCYHATINTGRAPNGQEIRNAWAHSFIGGLVPPSIVETASRCPNGVASVETMHSFLNMLAAGITWGIYSPMTIIVQCSGAGASLDPASTITVANRSSVANQEAMNEAVELSKTQGERVYVQFGR
jgi:hypothetical protein